VAIQLAAAVRSLRQGARAVAGALVLGCLSRVRQSLGTRAEPLLGHKVTQPERLERALDRQREAARLEIVRLLLSGLKRLEAAEAQAARSAPDRVDSEER
jgi:hypothetical protein